MKKLITLGLLSLGIVFLTGCTEQTQQNTNQTVAQAQELVYTNSEYGFTLTLPSTWEGYTTQLGPKVGGMVGDSDSVAFGFPAQDKLFVIAIEPKVIWEEMQKEEGSKPAYLGERDLRVFGYSMTQDAVNETMVARIAEIKDILKTFKVSQAETIDTENLSSYSNERLNIKFTYPQAWGIISEQDELPLIGQVTLRLSGNIFLSADNGNHSVDRGSYWGDYASFIEDQATISNFCQASFTSPERIKNCSILTNNNGIIYAKTQEEICTEAGCSGLATNYYFYNPNSEFRGVVISSALLSDNNFAELEAELDKLINNLGFTKLVEVTGGFDYYTAEAPDYIVNTALGKVCFTPAQFETVNAGAIFCFTNPESALAGLNIPTDENCQRYYWGTGTITIQNLTNNIPVGSKSDACFAEGSCLFNEAEFVKVIEISHQVECAK